MLQPVRSGKPSSLLIGQAESHKHAETFKTSSFFVVLVTFAKAGKAENIQNWAETFS